VLCIFFSSRKSLLWVANKQTENSKIALESKLAWGVQQKLGLFEQQTIFLLQWSSPCGPQIFPQTVMWALHARSLGPPWVSLYHWRNLHFWLGARHALTTMKAIQDVAAVLSQTAETSQFQDEKQKQSHWLFFLTQISPRSTFTFHSLVHFCLRSRGPMQPSYSCGSSRRKSSGLFSTFTKHETSKKAGLWKAADKLSKQTWIFSVFAEYLRTWSCGAKHFAVMQVTRCCKLSWPCAVSYYRSHTNDV